MIPARYQRLVFVFFMTLLMGVVLSLVFEFQGSGYRVDDVGGFAGRWLRRFLGTYIVVLPVVVLVSPIATRLSDLVVAKPHAPGEDA